MQDMATIHITRSEAVRDIDALLEKAIAGTEIVIESEKDPSIVLRVEGADVEEPDHAAWVRRRVQAALDDSRPRIAHEDVTTRIEKKFAAALVAGSGDSL